MDDDNPDCQESSKDFIGIKGEESLTELSSSENITASTDSNDDAKVPSKEELESSISSSNDEKLDNLSSNNIEPSEKTEKSIACNNQEEPNEILDNCEKILCEESPVENLVILDDTKICDVPSEIASHENVVHKLLNEESSEDPATSKNEKICEEPEENIDSNFKELSGESPSDRFQNILSNKTEPDEEPPEPFRTLNVTPTVHDLFDDNPYLRAAKVCDRYNSVDHYLDVQFRLLREDFLTPLRRGLDNYLSHMGQRGYRNNDMRIYRKVKLITPNKGVTLKASFGKLTRVNWYQSKRLMHGGLLMLSDDDFRSILFVTVVNRNEKDLEEGFVSIELCDETAKITKSMYSSEFVMLESKIFFEPYLTVLNAMKRMDAEEFPMGRYLIDANGTPRPPRYLSGVRELEYKDFALPLHGDNKWPSAERLKLDETQYDAFKHALTEELALIQGPPGTGKTFIALEIVSTLLENKLRWKRHGPIVVVCYTNHALDQFLEGILQYTKSIVRIGGQSKNRALEPHTLVQKRRSIGRTRNRNYDASYRLREARDELEVIERKLDEARYCVKCLTNPEAIVALEYLNRYVTDNVLSNMEDGEDVLMWLFEEDDYSVLSSVRLPEQLENGECERVYDTTPSEFAIFLPLAYIDEKMAQVAKSVKFLLDSKIPHDLKEYQIYQLKCYETELVQQRRSISEKLKHHPLTEQSGQTRAPEKSHRWRTYWNWVKRSYERAVYEVAQLERRYREERAIVNQMRNLLDVNILEEHDIVGLTTTGAARLSESLLELHAPIVLVEEAAEIFESHVICSMTASCQHLILIGDHKQLQPKASTYEIGKKYNLNISLFERMVNIRGGTCPQLAHQHRMRPEIAKLITPSIYKNLYNDESVLNYDDIKGLEKSLFFLNHDKRETSCDNESSWENEHEAKFLIAFAGHLVKQGYDPGDITVLCTYTGQLFLLRKERDSYNKANLRGLYVTTVDNYQGEENKIILLSLVRNNGEGNVGFLKEENRVCVALSRAREGLYIMGNMGDLVVKNKIWPQIRKVLEKQNSIGDFLQVRCQVHTDKVTKIKNVDDFNLCPGGGCSKKCETLLSCGHNCSSVCHVLDREHKMYRCNEPCTKSCPNGHPCKLECWKDCGQCLVMVERTLKCGHTVEMLCSTDPEKFACYIQVNAVLPDCKHEIVKSCSLSVEQCSCSSPCEIRLPCGHVCTWNCHVNKDPDHIDYKCLRECTKTYLGCENDHPCTKRCHEECGLCPIPVEKHRSCGHHFKEIACSTKVEEESCLKPCLKNLECGHKCPRKCSEPCGNCQEIVKKTSTCGHEIKIKCCKDATKYDCTGPCQKLLACGHACMKRCKDECIMSCMVTVELPKPGLCGHIFSVPCYLFGNDPSNPALLKYCKEPCKTELDCKHLCSGNCGKCLQGRIHVPCSEPCSNILICGHKCETPCREECRPCKKPCEMRCAHSKCGSKCGMPCVPCKEKCKLGCKHQRCSRKCSEPCNIGPCDKPCSKLLKCKHPCIGFCGEPCPPLCRICHEDQLTEILFGNEDDADARFVFLKDCNHCIESKGLVKWVESGADSISMKRCPRCKTEIKDCPRIMSQIKKRSLDVMLVKRKLFYNNRTDLKEQQQKCLLNLKTLKSRIEWGAILGFGELYYLLEDMEKRGLLISKNKRNQNLSVQELNAFEVQMQILIQMIEVMQPFIVLNASSRYRISSISSIREGSAKISNGAIVRDQVKIIVESIPQNWHITKQTIEDIQSELQRLRYIIQLCCLDISAGEEFEKVKTIILTPRRFTEELEVQVKSGIKELEVVLKKEIEIIVAERQMIAKAMNFNKPGHWYKCPNGHIYSIGECGGATQTSTCPECKETIGGTDHKLLSSNSLASEMDGATAPAWPTALLY